MAPPPVQGADICLPQGAGGLRMLFDGSVLMLVRGLLLRGGGALLCSSVKMYLSKRLCDGDGDEAEEGVVQEELRRTDGARTSSSLSLLHTAGLNLCRKTGLCTATACSGLG